MGKFRSHRQFPESKVTVGVHPIAMGRGKESREVRSWETG